MKIIPIFAPQLYAFHYDDEKQSELLRLLELWNNTAYLYDFVKTNKNDVPQKKTLDEMVIQLQEDAEKIDDLLLEIETDSEIQLDAFFKNLNNSEYRIDLHLSKQKARENYLRIYAIKIDKNCYVITGGAIKFHHLNKNRIHTQIEMEKLDRCRDYLKSHDVIDSDSFFEFLNEEL
jgi:hypothetical protein